MLFASLFPLHLEVALGHHLLPIGLRGLDAELMPARDFAGHGAHRGDGGLGRQALHAAAGAVAEEPEAGAAAATWAAFASTSASKRTQCRPRS